MDWELIGQVWVAALILYSVVLTFRTPDKPKKCRGCYGCRDACGRED